MHKFSHHKQKLPDIFASYFTENSLVYHCNTRGKVIYMSQQFSQSLGEGY